MDLRELRRDATISSADLETTGLEPYGSKHQNTVAPPCQSCNRRVECGETGYECRAFKSFLVRRSWRARDVGKAPRRS